MRSKSLFAAVLAAAAFALSFSTASVEGMRLVAAGRPAGAAVHAGGMLGVSLLASTLGLMVGRALA